MSQRDDDQNNRKKKKNAILDDDDDPKPKKKQSSIMASVDDDDLNKEMRNTLNLKDNAINYQIQLLNQACLKQYKYEFLMKIHTTSVNTIFFAVNKPTGPKYEKSNCFAIKACPYQTASETKNNDKEVQIVYKFKNNQSIIKYIDSFQEMYFDRLHKFIVMNYFEYLDLMEASFKIIDGKNEFCGFPKEDICQIAFQALNILKLLKDNKIVHNKIILRSFLLKTKNPIRLVLTGFDYADSIEEKLSDNFKGFPYTHAPEVLDHKPHDTSADVWSLGVLLYQLFAKCNPFYLLDSMDDNEALDNILNTDLDQSGIPDIPYRLISQMLEKDPNKRISPENALKSEWFNKIKLINLDDSDTDTNEESSIYVKSYDDSLHYEQEH